MNTFLITAIVIGLLITVHEFGHFWAARRAGVRVEEFAIGFGPKITGVRRGPTEYSFRVVPIGGFVRLAGIMPGTGGAGEPDEPGMEFRETSRPASVSDEFHTKPILSRMAIIAAGPAMNFLLAIFLFFLVFGFLGVPSEPTLRIAGAEQGLPAYEAGLRPGDLVLSVDGEKLDNWNELVNIVKDSPGKSLHFRVLRDGTERILEITPVPRSAEDPRGYVGIRPVMKAERLGPGKALMEGIRLTGNIVIGWFHGIAGLIRGTPGMEVLGIVGIGEELGKASRLGVASLIFFTAFLSANLGLLNLLPVPALDGSRLVFLTMEGVRGKPIDPEKEGFIHFVGFAFLILLAIFITYRDIMRLDIG